MRSELIAITVVAALAGATRAHAQGVLSEPPPPPPDSTLPPATFSPDQPPPPPPTPPVETPPPTPEAPAPTPTPTPEAPTPTPTPSRSSSHDDDWWAKDATERSFYFALEVGQGSFADTHNIYTKGLGRGFVFGLSHFELEFAQYDLEDSSKMFVNVAHADGIASVTTFAYRFDLAGTSRASIMAIAGLSLLSRPSMMTEPFDPCPIIGGAQTELSTHSQWGLGAVVGAGIQLGGLLFIDVRAYPTMWSGMDGTRLELADGATAAAGVVITNDTTPGGIPITINAGVGIGF